MNGTDRSDKFQKFENRSPQLNDGGYEIDETQDFTKDLKTLLAGISVEEIDNFSIDDVYEYLTAVCAIYIDNSEDFAIVRTLLDRFKNSLVANKDSYIQEAVVKILDELDELYPKYTIEYLYEKLFVLNAQRLTLGTQIVESGPTNINVMDNTEFATLDNEILGITRQIDKLSIK